MDRTWIAAWEYKECKSSRETGGRRFKERRWSSSREKGSEGLAMVKRAKRAASSKWMKALLGQAALLKDADAYQGHPISSSRRLSSFRDWSTDPVWHGRARQGHFSLLDSFTSPCLHLQQQPGRPRPAGWSRRCLVSSAAAAAGRRPGTLSTVVDSTMLAGDVDIIVQSASASFFPLLANHRDVGGRGAARNGYSPIDRQIGVPPSVFRIGTFSGFDAATEHTTARAKGIHTARQLSRKPERSADALSLSQSHRLQPSGDPSGSGGVG